VRKTHDSLTRSHHLSWLSQGLEHYAVRVGQQGSVARFVAGNASAGLGRVEIGPCRFSGRPGLVIFRCRHGTTGDEIAESNFVLRSLSRTRPRGDNGFLVGAHREPEVGGIDTHERLTALHSLSGIDQAFRDLAGNAEPEVALDASRDDARERAPRLDGAADNTDSHQWCLRSRICWGSVAASCQYKGHQAEKRKQGFAGRHGRARAAVAADDSVRAFESDAWPVPILDVQCADAVGDAPVDDCARRTGPASFA
jgi:hypothetical protein